MILYTNLNNIRERKKIIIPESKLALLSEALSDEVFHYTSLNTGLKAENFHKDSKEKQLTTGVHQWVK